ncbi:beta-lactamase-like protein [Alteromonas macleodii str. 'Balearic Sea AD45']|uniref:serine hydrolase domain-containing protein n=1 Tax=Alteromonas macleodii TaxID=28108 RepID=UPI000286D06E|nr:serine hydrolase domain-containing protein [Alteromonas macleodii]AFT94864.1 beta-lactamase-like protein [Alteromonas macleodii str. 'Balearic Sea AD45']
MYKLVGTLFLTAFLTACGGSNSNEPSPNPNPSPDRFSQLRTTIEQDLTSNNTAAISIAIYQEGDVVFAEAFGEKVKGTGEPVTTDTLFQLGSTTKMFTAVSTLQLIEQGSITLDDNLVNVVPQIQYPGDQTLDWQGIEIQHLLTHQSGLRDSGLQSNEPLQSYMKAVYPQQSRLMNPPGLFHNYSNPNWSYLGVLIEELSGVGFDEYVKTNIFDDLGMTRSAVGRSGAVANGNYALGYQALDPNEPGTYVTNISQIPETTVGHPAGTETWSTPTEQLKMAEFLLNGNESILGNEFREQLTTAHVSENFGGLPVNYGYGIYVNEGFNNDEAWYPIRNWNHGGNTLSYTSVFYVFPDLDIAISIMSSGAFSELTPTLLAALDAVTTLPASTELPLIPNDPTKYVMHEGVYTTENFTFIIEAEGNNLTITIPELDSMPQPIPYERELAHFGDDTFFAEIGGEVSNLTFIPIEADGESVYIRNRELVAIKDGY